MKTLLLLLLPGLACAVSGPMFKHEDPKIQREFVELYNSTKSSGTAVNFRLKTLAELRALTPKDLGEAWACSNCATDMVCVSSGTGTGAFVRFSARTTACQ